MENSHEWKDEIYPLVNYVWKFIILSYVSEKPLQFHLNNAIIVLCTNKVSHTLKWYHMTVAASQTASTHLFVQLDVHANNNERNRIPALLTLCEGIRFKSDYCTLINISRFARENMSLCLGKRLGRKAATKHCLIYCLWPSWLTTYSLIGLWEMWKLTCQQHIKSLALGRCGNFLKVWIPYTCYGLNSWAQIVLRWMPENLIDDKTTLV